MNSKSILLVIGLLVCATIIANAQTTDDARIKVLRAEKPGVIKILHAVHTDGPVLVRFSNHDGVIDEDRVTGDFPKGVMLRYDLHKMFDTDFHIEIRSQNVNVTYKIVPSKDKQTFTAYLEKVEHRNQLLAAR